MKQKFLRIVSRVVAVVALAACSPITPAAPAKAPAASATTLTVFAAASLTDAFKALAPTFEAANPGVKVVYNFAGSPQLVQQIGQGAPADVFASANEAQMIAVVKTGRVVSDTARAFVRNRLVVIVPKDNKAGVVKLADLGRPGLKIVLADKAVPVGGYALDYLRKASILPEYGAAYSQTVLANVVSFEQDVRAVLAKVSLGEADAGVVYTTDVLGQDAAKVVRIDIPDQLNTIATYPIAVINDSRNADAAAKFMAYVLAGEGQKILATYGFISITGNP